MKTGTERQLDRLFGAIAENGLNSARSSAEYGLLDVLNFNERHLSSRGR